MSPRPQPSMSMVHHGRREPPFFRAKFRPPSRPRHFVRRHRLLSLLDDLTEYPITAIVAPAGAGKTVLAADWLRRCRRPCAWLTLDAADRDVTELWRSLVTAMDQLVPRTISDPDAQVSPGEDLAALLARTLRAAGGATPRVLVVDNVDRVDDDPAACDLLASFVTHRPAWLHLLLVSRRRPPLQVDRLRASGELADIHFSTLRFSQDEAVRLLTRLCPDLPSADLAAAAERANGWAAALQLTALAIRSHRSRAHPPAIGLPGAERLVDEYLWEEVLRPERPDLVGLLLCTAVVGRINYGLAEALTQRPDAGDLLEEAEAAGLFVTALDGGWFDVHSLVRDMLATRLERRWPDGLRELHARAAHWFEDVGDPLMALDHWQRAERPADALRVLSDLSLPLVEAGRSARVLEAVERIPPELVAADPTDAIRFAWCQLAAGESGFPDAVVQAEASVIGAPPPFPSRLETLRAVSSWLRADWRRAATEAHRALHDPTGVTDDPLDRFGWHLVSCGVALDERWDDGMPVVGEARAACVRDPASRWTFEGTRAVGLALAGRPLDALRVADNAKRAASSGRYETLRIELGLTEAVVARELDRREEAGTLLEGLARTSTYPDPVLQLVAQLELLRLRMTTGELAEASALLDEAEELQARLARLAPGPGRETAAPPACDLVARAGVELALAGDDPAAAARWSRQVSDPLWGPVGEAKIQLARGDRDQAAQTVRRASPRSPRHRVVLGLVLARALTDADRSAAAEAVGEALDLAAGHALLRTVAAEGAPLLELIELAAGRVPDTWMDRLRHALVPVWSSRDAQRPVEDLTDRERDVLRLLPSRLTLAEIASELYVSPNTLKFHLRAIYRKLGVVSRAQAVDSARHTRLLPRG